MYHAIVKRRLLNSFEALNRGDYQVITRQFAKGAVHWFSGTGHPLAGKRRTLQTIFAWYDRLADEVVEVVLSN